MNIQGCEQLCTARKCEELEARIGALEQALELLEAAFESHTQQDIPTAHDYTPTVSAYLYYDNGLQTLYISVEVDNVQDTEQIYLPLTNNSDLPVDLHAYLTTDSKLLLQVDVGSNYANAEVDLYNLINVRVSAEVYDGNNLGIVVDVGESQGIATVELPTFEPFTTFDIFPLSNNQYQFQVSINGDSDSDVLTLPELSQTVDVDVELNSSNQIGVTVAVGDRFDYDAALLPNANVSIDVFNNDSEGAIIKVGVGNDSDEDYIRFPAVPELDPHVESNLSLSASYRDDILTITVADGESQDTATVFIDADVINNFGGGSSDVSCENLSQEFQDCCNQILSAVAANLAKIQEVENAVTVDIAHTINTDYKCEFETDDNDEIIPTYATHTFVEKEYEGKGLIGIHESLKKVHEHLDEIYINSCKAIPPEVELDLSKGLEQLCQDNKDNNLQTADEFDNEQGFFNYIRDALFDLAGSSITRLLVNRLRFTPGSPATFAVGTTVDFALSYLVERGTAAETEGLKTICDAIAELEEETITILASESDLGRVEGNVLILHFVSSDNYPKRQRGSNKRPVRIPAPKDEYDWDTDFKDIRWETGNQFAKLKLEGQKQGITGWFKNVAAANAYFDQLIGLTTAEETGRVIPIHTNLRTDIVVKTTRPYRAFVSREVNPGEGETLTKYYPTDEPEEN